MPRWRSARTGWRRRAMSPRRGDSQGVAVHVAAMVCDLERGAECAEFTDKALVHAAAMPSGEAKSRTMGILRLAQVRVLILQGTTDEAEALAAQFLIEPLCCEQTLHLVRSYALRLGGRVDEAARAADQAISMARAKGGLFEQAWLLAWRGLAELDSGRPRAGAGFGRAGDALITKAQLSTHRFRRCVSGLRTRAARQRPRCRSTRAAAPVLSLEARARPEECVGGQRPSTGSGKPTSPVARPTRALDGG